MTLPLAYVATPYSKYHDGLEIAFRFACMVTGRLIEKGLPAFSPIVHSHAVVKYSDCGLNPVNHELWIAMDRAMMDAATALYIVMMPGWKESKGIEIETEVFRLALKPIYYVSWPEMVISDHPVAPLEMDTP